MFGEYCIGRTINDTNPQQSLIANKLHHALCSFDTMTREMFREMLALPLAWKLNERFAKSKKSNEITLCLYGTNEYSRRDATLFVKNGAWPC